MILHIRQETDQSWKGNVVTNKSNNKKKKEISKLWSTVVLSTSGLNSHARKQGCELTPRVVGYHVVGRRESGRVGGAVELSLSSLRVIGRSGVIEFLSRIHDLRVAGRTFLA